ncbi:MAG: tRNA uridine-5-carboxymethylaminomethyl(34) synthesis GTPase MnmE [Lachnospiraceae bacterium]|nr:tRNA uridine-5-carboxymethylaminomethyl(34) synthesis GTPase MnmE [Lachnospiraceae bacterium]
MSSSDTIAAIATALSDSGIGIVRVSGKKAIEIVNRIYRSKEKDRDGNDLPIKSLFDYKSHTIHYGFIYDGDELLDEVMVAIMKAPNSFTMEDTVEIDCHGGVLVTNRILEAVIRHGARIAEPGEFTKRAFLNGRIDLSKAEAIIDLIHAKSEFALKSSVKQLKGSVSDAVRKLREEILFEIAHIESALDDPEHISLEGYPQQLSVKVDDMQKRVDRLLATSKNGKLLKEGINTVILGKPNAGKSSLLNLLVGEERAIVTNIAGTTRDALEETISLNGIILNVIDTAGIRDAQDVVEQIGVDRAKKYAMDADLIIYVVDSSVSLDESDEEIIKLMKEKKTIVLLNKTDLNTVVDEDELRSKISQIYEHLSDGTDISGDEFDFTVIRTSVKENVGMQQFEETIRNMFFQGEISFNDEVYITNMRHKEALLDTKNSLEMVKKSLLDDMPEDFYSIDLMSAYASLGTIIGEEVGEDLVNEIFSKFCMGK